MNGFLACVGNDRDSCGRRRSTRSNEPLRVPGTYSTSGCACERWSRDMPRSAAAETAAISAQSRRRSRRDLGLISAHIDKRDQLSQQRGAALRARLCLAQRGGDRGDAVEELPTRVRGVQTNPRILMKSMMARLRGVEECSARVRCARQESIGRLQRAQRRRPAIQARNSSQRTIENKRPSTT